MSEEGPMAPKQPYATELIQHGRITKVPVRVTRMPRSKWLALVNQALEQAQPDTQTELRNLTTPIAERMTSIPMHTYMNAHGIGCLTTELAIRNQVFSDSMAESLARPNLRRSEIDIQVRLHVLAELRHEVHVKVIRRLLDRHHPATIAASLARLGLNLDRLVAKEINNESVDVVLITDAGELG